jgi:hypothetical protein
VFVCVRKHGIPDHDARAWDLRDNSFLDFDEAGELVEDLLALTFLAAREVANFPNQHAFVITYVDELVAKCV